MRQPDAAFGIAAAEGKPGVLSAKIDKRFDNVLAAVARFILRRRVHPNVLTFIGLFINVLAAVAFAYGRWRTAAVLMLCAGSFDMFDGAVARKFGLASEFGAFLDSVVDRCSDILLLTSIAIFYARQAAVGHLVLVGLALLGTVLVPYVRAKAETAIPVCNVGLMERAERILVLAAGAFFDLMTWALIVLAVLTHVTVLQRVHFTWRQLAQRLAAGAGEDAAATDQASVEAKVLPFRRRNQR